MSYQKKVAVPTPSFGMTTTRAIRDLFAYPSEHEESIGYKDRDDSTDALLAKDYTQKPFPTSSSTGFAHINSLGRIKIMPAHRHRCVLCGCSRCCCVRQCVWAWITFFILIMMGCIAVLTLDGVYSLQHGHTFAR